MHEYFHVTDVDSAESIMKHGFEGGWGDLGYGVYFWGTLHSALDYADEGGWDRRVIDPVIIAVGAAPGEIQEITGADLDVAWDPASYEDMYWHPMEEDTANWRPAHMRIVEIE